jgi:hypothetical protein
MTVSLARSPGCRGKWNSEHWCLKARELEVNAQVVGGRPSVEPTNAIFSGTSDLLRWGNPSSRFRRAPGDGSSQPLRPPPRHESLSSPALLFRRREFTLTRITTPRGAPGLRPRLTQSQRPEATWIEQAANVFSLDNQAAKCY